MYYAKDESPHRSAQNAHRKCMFNFQEEEEEEIDEWSLRIDSILTIPNHSQRPVIHDWRLHVLLFTNNHLTMVAR